MVHSQLDSSHVIVEGQLVSTKVSQVVQAIHEYDRDIHVEWMPDKRERGLPEFRIIYRPENEPEFILFYVKNESEMDARVLQRIIANDQRNGVVTLSEFEAWEEAQNRIRHQQFLDELELMEDITKHALESPLNSYKVNNDLIIRSDMPHNAAHLDKDGKPIKGSQQAAQQSLFGDKRNK